MVYETGAGGFVQDDLSYAKIHSLQQVGEAFGSLIFGMESDSGATKLCENWKQSWESIKHKEEETKKMVVRYV